MAKQEAAPSPLGPEELFAQLRSFRERIAEFSPLTPEQRKALTPHSRISDQTLMTSIDVVGVVDKVSQAVGHSLEEVHQMIEEAGRWTTVENELRALWNGVNGANLMRRRRIEFIATQAAAVAARLARDPAHSILLPHVQEIRRLRSYARRRRAAAETETPEPTEGS